MKACASPYLGCSYRTITSAGSGCSYAGQCSYQLPQEPGVAVTYNPSDRQQEIIDLLTEILYRLRAMK